MSERMTPGKIPHIEGTLHRVCGEPQPVDPLFSLLPSPLDEEGVYEFFGGKIDSHVILIDEASVVSPKHQLLSEKTDIVFPDVRVGDRLLLIVPEGSRSIQGLLPQVARNVNAYSGLFHRLGNALSQIEGAHMGLPSGADLLGSFAFAASMESRSGGQVFFLPPYELDYEQSSEQVVNDISLELERSGVFNIDEILQLTERVESGRHDIG